MRSAPLLGAVFQAARLPLVKQAGALPYPRCAEKPPLRHGSWNLPRAFQTALLKNWNLPASPQAVSLPRAGKRGRQTSSAPAACQVGRHFQPAPQPVPADAFQKLPGAANAEVPHDGKYASHRPFAAPRAPDVSGWSLPFRTARKQTAGRKNLLRMHTHPQQVPLPGCPALGGRAFCMFGALYSTVTLLARFRGLSMSQPRCSAT
jgi:hypothetical protein